MNDKERQAIERMNDLIYTCEVGIQKHGAYDDLFQKDKEAIETVLNLIENQQAELEGYKKTLDIFDNRKYRKRYLEEERAKRPRLLYPDADEIYRRYYEQKVELEKKDKIIDEMAIALYEYSNLEVLIKCPAEYDGRYNMDLCEMNLADRNCIICIKEYFENKATNKK